MNVRKKFLQLTSYTYPHGTENDLKSYLPQGYKEDGCGNFYIIIGDKPTTMFTCHLDTADRKQMKVKHVISSDIIKTDGSSILGADDKAGMTVILYMIEKNIPGLYYFFIGEERGCIGSQRLSRVWNSFDFSTHITKCVSFDRRGTDSIITEQFYGVCCSDEFATELSNRLNSSEVTFNYRPDPTGIYTDSAQFISLIPECTNISVGYYNEHTTSENQNIKHLEKLCESVCKIDWESLPITRDSELESEYFDDEFSYEFEYSIDEEWCVENYSYFRYEKDSSTKMFISKTQIEKEKDIIKNWLNTQGFCPGYGYINWNGNSLYVEYSGGKNEYLGDRIELCDFIPELMQVPDSHVRLILP